jgi:pterin-4a-carbinolamine dehydratase
MENDNISKSHNHTIGTKETTKRRIDPMTRRPNKVCDPYGQGGKPLLSSEAKDQMATLDEGWVLMYDNHDHDDETTIDREGNGNVPKSLQKEFYHANYIHGSKFTSLVAAVAHMNNHYPTLSLERRLERKEKAWSVVTTVKCHTPTLGGLSYNDFHIALLVDVEVAREETRPLLCWNDEERFLRQV